VTSLQNLIQKAQRGDRVAFDEFITRCTCRLEALIRGHLGPRLRGKIEVADVRQTTFLKAWQAIGGFHWQGEEALWAWLGTLARHVIQDEARRIHTQKQDVNREVSLAQKVRSPHGDFGELVDLLKASATSPSDVLRRDERFERLRQSMQCLSPDHRKVVFLVCVREMRIKDVAQQMGRRPKAVSMLLFRALKKLKEVFGTTDSLHLPERSLEEEGHGE
jgi:RNA polymerase sigma-70 factor (subfamily 1)